VVGEKEPDLVKENLVPREVKGVDEVEEVEEEKINFL
tara:strand:- start:388 stop:498 length:111 start_codon:yes stop_codon:yes gene_type:complete